MAFSFTATITIDHTKCGASNSTNWPFMFNTTSNFFRTSANGGRVQNANGYDLVFYSDSALTTKLDHEIEKYVASTGEFIAYVRIPTLSHTADTVIYLGYDDSSISTSQENITGVWNSNYKAVYHLKDGTSLNVNDSTSNAYNGTTHNTPTADVGQIDGGMKVVTGSSQYFSASIGSISAPFYASVWTKPASTGLGRAVLSEAGGTNFFLQNGGSGNKWQFFNTTSATNSVTPGRWDYLALTQVGTTEKLYFNGALDATSTLACSFTGLDVGRRGDGVYWDGIIDEVRVMTADPGADWILADYNNQSSPSTFYTVAYGGDTAGQYFPPAF